jgi:hypothetical protein
MGPVISQLCLLTVRHPSDHVFRDAPHIELTYPHTPYEKTGGHRDQGGLYW